MHLIRLFVLSFLILLLVVTGISFFIPSHVRLSRAVNIVATDSAIWHPIQDINQWPAWNPFFADLAPGSLQPIDSVEGQLRTALIKGTTIRLVANGTSEWTANMERPSRQPVVNGWKIIRHPGGDTATVQWYMDFRLRWYPWEKFSSLLFERSYGPGMETGLGNLRSLIAGSNRISSN